jgi:hypothetical protein
LPGLLLDPVELVDEVHVPGGPAELAVGRALEAEVFLHAHDVGDGSVLDRAQLVGFDATCLEVVARLEEDLRADYTKIANARDSGLSEGSSALLRMTAPIYQGAEMPALMSIEKAFVTYLEGMTRASQNAELGDLGACRRR